MFILIMMTGLLHSAPEDVATHVAQLLQACVHESSGGERLRAVEELKDLLAEEGGLDDEDVDYEDEYSEGEKSNGEEPAADRVRAGGAIGGLISDYERKHKTL
jgi:hypothetical protein